MRNILVALLFICTFSSVAMSDNESLCWNVYYGKATKAEIKKSKDINCESFLIINKTIRGQAFETYDEWIKAAELAELERQKKKLESKTKKAAELKLKKAKAAAELKLKKAKAKADKEANILIFKNDCLELGFKKDTEAMGNCVLKLMEINKTNISTEAQSEEILSVELAKLKIEIERLKLEKARFENEKNQTKVAAYNAQIMAAMQRMQSTQNALKNFQNAQKSFESVGY